jgi:oligopeptide transport system ATP-binding protein
VDGVSFDLERGKTLAVVGESGCGKTTAGRAVLRLIEPTDGEITFRGQDLRALGPRELRAARRHMQIIFQDPYASLNPRQMVGRIIGGPLMLHGLASDWNEAQEMARSLLERVGLQAAYASRYPHEFSGGQRQRIGIARAVALRPDLIVCDEAVSALDVSVQAQVINLLLDIQEDMGLSYLFITHDLSVVRHFADDVLVMYLGRVAEKAPRGALFEAPRHPYTQALLSAVPRADPRSKRKRVVLEGDVPSPIQPPSGCRFHTRCPLVEDRCRVEEPASHAIGPNHEVLCHLYEGRTEQVDLVAEMARREAARAGDV